MKKQILAYVTALTNNEIMNMKRFKSYGDEPVAVAAFGAFKNKLDCLSDFVADLNGGEETDESIYAKRIVGLIEDCKKLRSELSSMEEYKNEIVKVGFENVTKLKAEIHQLEHDMDHYQTQHQIDNNAIRNLQSDNKMRQETCNILKAENEKLKGPHWVQD